MVKKKLTALVLTLAMLPSFGALASDDNQVYIDLSVNSDMFLSTSGSVTKDYNDGLYYYNGDAVTESIIEIDGIEYRLYTEEGAMSNKVNDVLKISEETEILLNNNPAKTIGVMLFTREAQTNSTLNVEVNYQNGETESYDISALEMTNSENGVSAGNPLQYAKKGLLHKAVVVEDETVYFHSVSIDTTQSVNKSSALKSIVLPAADFTYYVVAITQINYTEAEIESQTQQIIAELYSKYAAADFKEVVEGKDGMSPVQAEALEKSLLSQSGKMEEATAENIEKIQLLVEGSKLYSAIVECRAGIAQDEGSYLDVSADFEELSQTTLTDEDYATLENLLSLYASYEAVDIERLYELADHYGISDSIDVNVDLSNKDHIQALYDAYKKAVIKGELRTEIEKYYDTYAAKDITEITSADEDELLAMIECFDRAKENGITFSEYEPGYIRHLYNDYEIYKTSDTGYTIDISEMYNADSIANAGDTADKNTWYESVDNISGSKLSNATHLNVASYNAQTGEIQVKEYQYQDNGNSEYKFVATGNKIPFIMPKAGFSGSALDTVLFKANSDMTKTVNMNNVYADKIYLLMTGGESEYSVNVLYNDGTTEVLKFKLNAGSQFITKVKEMAFPNLVGYIQAGDYSDFQLNSNGVIELRTNKSTSGIGVFAIEPDSTKGIASLTFNAAGKAAALYGMSVMPESNANIIQYIEGLYAEVVNGEEINTTDISKISSLVLAYEGYKSRGLYSPVINEDVVEDLKNMVLTSTATVYRKNKNCAVAEVEFSVPVEEESAKAAIAVSADGVKITNFSVSFNDDSTKMTIEIPVTKENIESFDVKVEATVKIAAYPNISMIYPAAVNKNMEAYVTATYEAGIMKISNNSLATQDYIVYAQAADDQNIYSVKTAEGTLNAEDEEEITIILSSYPAECKMSAAVLDKNTLEPLAAISEVAKYTGVSQSNASYTEPTFNLETNTLTVNGFTPSKKADKAVSVYVTLQNADVYFGVIKTNSDGYFEFNIPVNSQNVPEGTFEIKLGGEDFDAVYSNNNISFSNDNTRKTFVNSLKSATNTDEVYSLLSQAESALSISFKPLDYILQNEAAKRELSARIFAQKDKLQVIEDGDSSDVINEKASIAQELIKAQAILWSIEKGKKELFAADGALLYEDIIGYSSIDVGGVTLYKLFNEGISAEGKANVISNISSKSFADSTALKNELKKIIMLNALIYPNSNGIGYVERVLTQANADAIGITITKYLNLSDKTSASSYIANMSISSLDDVTNYISTLGTTQNQGGINGGINGGGAAGSGGGGGATTNKVGANTVATGAVAEVQTANTKFYDLPKSHWGYNAVMALNEKGIISGYGDRSFGTDKTITRAEFVKLMCVVNETSVSGYENVFTDVNASDWYAPYVYAAFKSGIVNGITDDEFGPDMPITRQDICTILYRVSGAKSDSETTFADSNSIADYAKSAVGYFSQKGIVNGFDGNLFKPTENATRVQAAMIIYNYLNNQGI